MKTTLSLAMIVKDSEKVLDKCLASCYDLFDEIVIIDTGSTDKTKEIASKYTSKVYDFSWTNDFAKARNYSFSKCTSDFIMWLDDDDFIPESEKKKIQNLDFTDKEMIILPYMYSIDEFGVSECVVERERIIKRSLGLQWQKKIHEHIPVDFSKKVSRENIQIIHYKKSGTSERNLSILEEIVKYDHDPRNFYYLGKELYEFFKYEKAVGVLLKFVKMNGWWEDIFNAYRMIALCYLNLKEDNKFFKHIFKSIEIEPRRAEPFFDLGTFYSNKQDWSRAAHYFEICLNVKRPVELLSTFSPQYYTWKPALELSVCYFNMKDFEKAKKYNELFISFRPKDSRGHNNRQVISNCLDVKKEGQGKKLNLGCGNKTIEGYVNVDLFKSEKVDEVFNLDSIPYKDGTIAAINSEHSLEHLEFDRVRPTLKEWFRVLQDGGELFLKIPDLEWCCQEYLKAPINAENYFNTKMWFKSTIYGIQKSQAGEPDEAQLHRSGFSKQEIKIVLEDTGFVIDVLENYNGWGTPSINIHAIKPVSKNQIIPIQVNIEPISKIKIGWIAPINWEAAQTRIRVLNIDKQLNLNGYCSKVIDYSQANDYNIVIVGKAFDEDNYNNIKKLKQNGKIIFCDLCESILEFPYVKEIISICDKVICCSYTLAEQVREFNSNIIVIEDSYET